MFILIAILFFVISYFAIIAFLLVIFNLVVIFFSLPDSITTAFLGDLRFFAVMTFWYVCTFFMPTLFYFVPIFPASCAGTLALRFYVEGIFIFY